MALPTCLFHMWSQHICIVLVSCRRDGSSCEKPEGRVKYSHCRSEIRSCAWSVLGMRWRILWREVTSRAGAESQGRHFRLKWRRLSLGSRHFRWAVPEDSSQGYVHGIWMCKMARICYRRWEKDMPVFVLCYSNDCMAQVHHPTKDADELTLVCKPFCNCPAAQLPDKHLRLVLCVLILFLRSLDFGNLPVVEEQKQCKSHDLYMKESHT